MKKVLFLAALLTSTILPVMGAEKVDLSARWSDLDRLKNGVETLEKYDFDTQDPEDKKTLSSFQNSLLKAGIVLIGFEAIAKANQIQNKKERDRFQSSYSWSFLQLINFIYPLYAKAVHQKLFHTTSASDHTFEGFAKTHAALLLPFVKSMKQGTFEIAPDDKFDPALKLWVENESYYFIKLLSGSAPDPELDGYQRTRLLFLAGQTFSHRLQSDKLK